MTNNTTPSTPPQPNTNTTIKARFKMPRQPWATTTITARATRHGHHGRITLTITGDTTTRLELTPANAYNLTNLIVDTLES
ncbi:hypothetical protein [Corynebacterium pseudopelargi]|uniref:Uncharacterized protein n=1 Tax=Corynebacterium pseudopelargi TaxID=2080757 RepID=A0A3G6IWM6_9CORY|nr:hypothetical protein [Corynebacterium pseudopelargi]AZA08500.1 hypothetical protein CPPEL_01770 [Corynebacterium pseudopelargi]